MTGSSPTRRTARAAATTACLALGLVLAGCGGSGGDASSAGAAASSAAGAAASAAGSAASAVGSAASSVAAGPDDDKGTVVTVRMNEFTLELSQTTFSPGVYTFTSPNEGEFPHTISINGPGVDNQSAGGPAQGGETAPDLTVTLQPGTYEIWCPVGEHRQRGMETTITVT